MAGWWLIVAGWVADKFGGLIATLTIDHIQKKLRSIFANRNILILGSAQTGKTSLISYLTTGKPYKITDGTIMPPDKTLGTLVISQKKINIDGQKFRIEKDFPGDVRFRSHSIWRNAIRTLQPTGIIYMIDGRLDNTRLEKSLQEMYDVILTLYESGEQSGLVAMQICINFCDIWSIDERTERKKIREIDQWIDDKLAASKNLKNLKYKVSATQLSPNKNSWVEIEGALSSFRVNLLK